MGCLDPARIFCAGVAAHMQSLQELGIFMPGSRIGVLLIHGLTGTPTEKKLIARRLNNYGFSVLCPRLAGHCGSEAELLATNWQDWADSAENAFSRLAEHMDVVFVGGLSAGAVLSLYLSHLHPEKVRGAALYSITLRWDGWTIPKLSFLLPLVLRVPYIGKRYRFEEAFPYGLMNERIRSLIFSQMHSGDAEAAGFTGTPGFSLREMRKLVARVKKSMPDINTPTLVVHSSNDDVASAKSNALYVCNHLKGPCELLLLDNSYHMVTVDQERDKVGDATARFFNNLLSPAEKLELASKARKAVPESWSEAGEGAGERDLSIEDEDKPQSATC